MNQVKSVSEALLAAWEIQPEVDDVLSFGKFEVVPTIPSGKVTTRKDGLKLQGKSVWSRWVAKGYLRHDQVLWALRMKAGKLEWLGVLVQTIPGKAPELVDLRNNRNRLDELERVFNQEVMTQVKMRQKLVDFSREFSS